MTVNSSRPTHLARRPYHPFIIFMCILAFLASNVQSQGSSKSLKHEIENFSNTLANANKNDSYAKSALKFVKQIQIATEDLNPQQLATLKNNLRSLNFGAHHETLYSLLKKASAERTHRNELEQQTWSTQIDAFIEKAKQACIDDAPSLELETLRVEAAGLSLKRPQFLDSSTEWAKTETGKLDSAGKLIHRWLDYIEVKEKEDLKYAQLKLEYFLRNPTLYPILDNLFFGEKIKSILKERGVTETKSTEYRDGGMVTYIHTRPVEKPGQITLLARRQQEIIKNLESGNWDGKTVLGYAEELKALGKKEKRVPYRQTQTNSTIGYFGTCLLALEGNDLSKSQIFFSFTDFGHTSVPALKNLERTVMTQLFPTVYPTLSPPPLKNGKALSQYNIELLSEPESMNDVSNGFNLLIWINKNHWGTKGTPDWKKAANDQYKWLSRARSALESKDFPKALYDLRAALYYAPDAGPASAQTLIESEIRKLTKSRPELFTPSIPIAERLAKAEKQVRELEASLDSSQ